MSERNLAWARRFTTTALHAGLERPDNFLRDGCTIVLHCAHQRDATSRRSAFVPSNLKGRTMRQTQSTLHAGAEFGTVEVEVHQVTTAGSRPGFRRQFGSNSDLAR